MRPSISAHVKVGAPVLSVTWAPEDGFDPGATALMLGVRPQRTAAQGRAFLDLAAGVVYVDAEEHEARLAECTPEVGCMFEGVSHATGWGPAASVGAGSSLRVYRRLHFELAGALTLYRVEELHGFARAAVGLSWLW